MRSLGPSQFRRESADAELTEEGNGGGASTQIRRGRQHFDALDRCMGFAEREEEVPASFGAEHGRRTEGRDGGRQWLLTEGKGNKGGGRV
jgi:hypothetical protein